MKTNPFFNKRIFFLVTLLLVIFPITSFGNLTPQQLQGYKKKLLSGEAHSILETVREINETNALHPLLSRLLKEILDKSDIKFKFFIAETLIKIGDPYGLQFLKGKLKEETTPLYKKIEILQVLASTNSDEVIPLIKTYLNHENHYLQFAAIENLMKLGVSFETQMLLKLYQKGDFEQKASLLKILPLEGMKHQDIFIQALREKTREIALIALRELVKLEQFGGIDTIDREFGNIQNKEVLFETEFLLAEKRGREIRAITKEYNSLNRTHKIRLLYLLKNPSAPNAEGRKKSLETIKTVESDPRLIQFIERPLGYNPYSETPEKEKSEDNVNG